MTTRVKPRFRYRLATLLALMVIVAIAATMYGYRLRAIQRQEQAIRRIAAKGGTVFYSPSRVFVDFSISEAPTGMGVLCSNERVICPDYTQPSTFCDADLQLLSDVFHLYDVVFGGSMVTNKAARAFQTSHAILSIGPD